jgi:hypothetical protein
MPNIRLPDGSSKSFPGPVTVAEIAQAIGPGLARAALAGRVNGKLVDTGYRVESDADVTEVQKALESADVKHRLVGAGSLETLLLSPQDFNALIRRDYERFGKLIRDIGVKAD